jgi:hypothetical protein
MKDIRLEIKHRIIATWGQHHQEDEDRRQVDEGKSEELPNSSPVLLG